MLTSWNPMTMPRLPFTKSVRRFLSNTTWAPIFNFNSVGTLLLAALTRFSISRWDLWSSFGNCNSSCAGKVTAGVVSCWRRVMFSLSTSRFVQNNLVGIIPSSGNGLWRTWHERNNAVACFETKPTLNSFNLRRNERKVNDIKKWFMCQRSVKRRKYYRPK